jgi:hypothetical protein
MGARYKAVLYGQTTYSGGAAEPAVPPAAGFCIIARVSTACGAGGACGGTVYPGSSLRLSASFYSGETLADPLEVVLLTRSPAGAVERYEYGLDPVVVRDAAGKYRFDFSPDVGGDWAARWEVPGGLGATEVEIEVLESAFAAA